MGSIEKNIVEQCVRFGEPIPEKIENKPTLLIGLELYYDAFFDLATERTDSGLVSWSSMKEYAVFYGFDFEQTEDLIYFVRALDNAYLKRA